MAAKANPTVLRRYVGMALRRLRESAGLDREQVAAILDCSKSHVAQLEAADRTLPRAPEIKLLLETYGAADRIGAFQEMVASARRGTDWWRSFAGAAPEWFDLYVGFESAAAQIDTYAAVVVPGLFQTAAYARYIIQVGEPELDDRMVAHRVDLRMARQDVLTEANPPMIWAVLDESVLFRPAGDDPIVLRDQLEKLLKTMDLPNVTIQVLPLAVGVHAGVSGTFVLLSFPNTFVGDPGVAYAENRIRGTYFDQEPEVDRFRTTFRYLQACALSPADSRKLIARRPGS